MTVAELIKELEKLPPEMKVVVQSPEYWEGDTYYDAPTIDPFSGFDGETWLVLR